ncbi:hypothetical protein [Wolinella succinogenes]|uniref:hypothetical protein n=1 Tax=Wolinella succinogenes TaxID=844 RepID=UPI00240A1752|nr:hypothetical protein [Wolinella succinogenes]
MPYKNQVASKGGHSDIVKNPDVALFLGECDYMKEPSEEEANEIVSSFIDAPLNGKLPSKVVASDASKFSEPISGKFPSTQIGYVKVSLVLIDVENYNGLTPIGSRYVDPFKVAAIHRNADAFSFTLPGSNITYKKASSVANGFRLAIYEQLSNSKTTVSKDGSYNVRKLLFEMNTILPKPLLVVKHCPSCKNILPSTHDDGFVFSDSSDKINCPNCGESVYYTDSLRIHEEISDFGDNSSAITRFMNAVEHLIMATLIKMLADLQPKALSDMAFIIDGPLAIFGQPARLHSRLMALYAQIAAKLQEKGYEPPIIVGLQKDGQLMEHARALSRFIRGNTFKLVDDEYRFRHIKGSTSKSDNFGHETYYGQDFIFKTSSGKTFVVGMPYPFETKASKATFANDKANIDNYQNMIGRAFDVIRHFEFDLYENAVVPVALAHRHASISLIPGGKILELVSRNGLG